MSSRWQYEGTAFGPVRPKARKQTDDINSCRGEYSLKFTDRSVAEFSDPFGAAHCLRWKIRHTDFVTRGSSFGRCRLERFGFNLSGFGSAPGRLVLRDFLLDREEFRLGQFELAAKRVRLACQRR